MEWAFLILAVALVGWSLLSAMGGERQARRHEMHARVRLSRRVAAARQALAPAETH